MKKKSMLSRDFDFSVFHLWIMIIYGCFKMFLIRVARSRVRTQAAA